MRFGAVVLAIAVVAGACSGSRVRGGAPIAVVAAEGFWGSLAAQLGGDDVRVHSIVTDPNADPHDHEATAADARAVAGADDVIVNGVGYDPWVDKLVKANPRQGRVVLRVGDLVGKHEGDNPHLWYSPGYVERTADRITADFGRLDPAHRADYAARRTALRQAMQPYRDLVASIKAHWSGTRIGATETVFAYMADALGLDVVSPAAFMRAVADGNDPPAASVAAFQRQLMHRAIDVLVFNAQTATASTTNLARRARAEHIAAIAVTETLPRPYPTFQAWQVAQLRALQRALERRAA
ncbi:MAG: zinc ABC transporter substrate-binding protein [Actinobacteria bacterium]|nr:zinc ABC transporter substrate-binding protein [Actinomycetota bacterium]